MLARVNDEPGTIKSENKKKQDAPRAVGQPVFLVLGAASRT